MISAAILAVAALSAGSPLAAAPSGAALTPSTIAHLKGQMAIPASAEKPARTATVACHPEPTKGRACRVHNAQKERQRDERNAALASADLTGQQSSSR